jgi:hypothetical protein
MVANARMMRQHQDNAMIVVFLVSGDFSPMFCE